MKEFPNLIKRMKFPGLGMIHTDQGFIKLNECSDGHFKTGHDGVEAILSTGDRKVEFIAFKDHTLAYVTSAMGYPAYYPVSPVKMEKPIKAVLMDLDGTTVKSEEFWIWIIQETCRSLLGTPKFELQDNDLPYVSGHSVSEHLKYCINKYCPEKSIEEAKNYYFQHTHHEIEKILQGGGRKDAFKPAPGIKEFLYDLKAKNIKIALVTSGLYEKAYPEILSAFKTLEIGDPADFYDCIITAGFPLRKGKTGTLGELSPKPHPWLYAEAGRVGLGIPFEERNFVIGIEDSGAGVCSVRLAGYPVIGLSGGNIIQSGTQSLCEHYCNSFEEIMSLIK